MAPYFALRWLRANLVVIAGLLTLAYMILPNVVVMVFSFNKPNGRFNYAWQQFSRTPGRIPAASPTCAVRSRSSLQIAVWATVGATVLGTMIAFALARYRFRARGAVNSLIFLPMAMPEVVMAASLVTLFLNMGAQLGFWTILIAHIMFCLSFVVTAVKARVMSMDPRLEEAARDLYAGPVQTFVRVTLPIAAPGIAAGALLAFALSFDDFIITNFNAGSTVTFPMFVWGSAQRGTPVQINVIGTAMFLIAVLVRARGQIIGDRRKSRRGRVRIRRSRRIMAPSAMTRRRTSLCRRPARPVLAGRPRQARAPCPPSPATSMRPAGRRRRLQRTVDRADRQGARPGPRRGADRGPRGRAGPPPAATAASAPPPSPTASATAWPAGRTRSPSWRSSGTRNLDAIEAAVDRYGIDCDFERTGEIDVATEPHQVAELRERARGAGAARPRGRR